MRRACPALRPAFMRSLLPLIAMMAVTGCANSTSHDPSLAPREAEAIDPRVPIPDEIPTGQVDAALAERLQALVAGARAGVAQFEARQATADRLAAGAGPMASESWVAAQQALSLLVEQYGITARAVADIDRLAADRLESRHWIQPADRNAIAAAAEEVGAISASQSAAIERLTGQLTR